MSRKTALITGLAGQDGSHLAELLLDKGYVVHGVKRCASSFNTDRIDHIYHDPHVDNSSFKLHYGDLSDGSNLTRIMQAVQPDEVCNLGAQSHVAVSFESPEYTAEVDGMGTLLLLEATRLLGLEQKTASTKPPPANCRAWCRKSPKKTPPCFTHAAPMRWPNCMSIESR